MPLPDWNPDNLQKAYEKILLKAQDPDTAKEYRVNLCLPDFAREELKKEIAPPPHGWDRHLVCFESMEAEPENEAIDILTLPRKIGDVNYKERRACSYNRTY